MARATQKQIVKAVVDFINAQTWDESKRIVEAQRDALLTDAADHVFTSLLEQYRSDADTTSLLEEHRDLLARCRRYGIETAFAFQQILDQWRFFLDESKSLKSASDLIRWTEVGQGVLQLVDCNTLPQLWADFQNSFANRLAESPLGERAENLEQAIQHYEQALEEYTPQAFPEQWATVQRNLAVAYQKRIRGERAENLEQAIQHYEQALEVRTRQAFPEQWAETQYDLATAYQERIRGERADNLEQVIQLCQRALEVYTPQAFPEDWAATQHNLATAYFYRIRGERAENLEQAIQHYEQALEVSTRQAFPEDWARTQHTLAAAYLYRIRGERADNLEQVIQLCQRALEVYTPQAFPENWAVMQYNLAIAFEERIRGERTDNLEQAIQHYEQALEVYTPQAFPEQWATVQQGLAVAYQKRIRGERADNLERAIQLCQQALEVYNTPQAFPEQWAATQNTLAFAYSERIRGKRADNLERAIQYYEQVLEVRTRQAFPEDWARTQHNLAVAYSERIRGKRAENLEQAIQHFKQALEVRTRQAFPENWARTQHNLAVTYQKRIRGKRAENLERAIQHFKQALEVRTPLSFPQACRDTSYPLGRLLYEAHRFDEACRALRTAHLAVESLRGEVQREATKRTLAEENADLYGHLVSCCLREGDEASAFEYAVASKGRAFVDLLATTRLDLSALIAGDPALADDLRKARALREPIDNLLATLTDENRWSESGSSPAIGVKTFAHPPLPRDDLLILLRVLQATEASHWDEMAYKYPALTATQKVPILSTSQVCVLADELDATLVEYCRHVEGWCAFIVTSQTMHYVPLPLVDERLLARVVTWMQWIEYPQGRNPLSYHQLSEWHRAVITPLEAYLQKDKPVILAPFGVLHVLPLAAARDPHTGRFVGEDYQLAFAPSLTALHTMHQQGCRIDRDGQTAFYRLLNVAYPGDPESEHYLPNVLPEAQAIARYFAQVTELYQEVATPDAVVAHSRGQDVVHFGCHGWFDPEQPEQSGLLLARGWLTVQRIITELRLDQAHLATIGACFSGRAALQRGDEYVGLMQAMLTTGVQAVVTSLWPADDAATRALFEAFYARLIAGSSPAEALQQATEFIHGQPGWEHPYYWASFQVNGLAHGAPSPAQVHFPTDQEVRVDAPMQAQTRGGRLMKAEQHVEGALILLAQMSEYPSEVLSALNIAEQTAVMRELDTLAEQAAAVQSDADLLKLADAIHRLVEERPELGALLLPEGTDVAEERSQRAVTLVDYLATTRQNAYTQARASQMRNAVLECRRQLEAALRAATKPGHKPNQEKSHECPNQ